MTERPIIFSAPMVRALLDDRKTQTRRAVKPQPLNIVPFIGVGGLPTWEFGTCAHHHGVIDRHIKCPFGQPGDRLWVRETFAIVPRTAYACSDGVQQTLRPDDPHDAAIYRADWSRSNGGIQWRPSIHMPRWASRINLEITSVRVERLQDISEADAKAEGVCELPGQAAERGCWWSGDVGAGAALHGRTPFVGYRLLWEHINGARSWDANPWVWVIEFKRITP